MGGNPLGLFESFDHALDVRTGFSHLHLVNTGFDDSVYACNALQAVDLRAGTPGEVLARLHYAYLPGSIPYARDAAHTFSLHQVGLGFAGNAAQGLFRLGLNVRGRFGGSSHEDFRRLHLELDRADLFAGTTLFGLVRLHVGTGVRGFIDTLKYTEGNVPAVHEDNMGEMMVPLILVNVDVGNADVPYAGNLSGTIGKNYTVYSVRETHRPAIIVDTMSWAARMRYLLDEPLQDIDVMPAGGITFGRNAYSRVDATDDNYPWEYFGGDQQEQAAWAHGWFGINTGVRTTYQDMAAVSMEYGFTATSFDSSGESADSHGMHGFFIGVSKAPLTCAGVDLGPEVSHLDVELYYDMAQQDGVHGGLPGGCFVSAHPAAVNWQTNPTEVRYNARYAFEQTRTLHAVGMDIEAGLWDESVQAALGWAWLHRVYSGDPFDGTENGMRLSLGLRYRFSP
jgi:hypothetical protein